MLPAVTCSAQATLPDRHCCPREHGIVGNGWYFRDLAQVMFWRQANQLVPGEKVWETARRRDRGLHLRQDVLVVQHVQLGRLVGHAAADLPG